MRVLRGLGKLSNTPENTFIPVHTHMGPRTRSQVTIWSLPEEILLHLLNGLHIIDVLNMRAVHPYFRDLVDSYTFIWVHVSFEDTWPSSSNIKHFERASKYGNIEACVKLGIAYLYNEGLPGDFEGRRITSNGERAAEMFCKVESISSHGSPFTWLFIRPPWSVSGACCKECVFTYMKTHLTKVTDQSVMICVAKILELLDDKDKQKESVEYLHKASEQGSGVASYLLWEQAEKLVVHDRASQLESIRKLRDIAKVGELDAQLALCKCYVTGKYGGISKQQATSFVRDFVQSSKPTNAHKLFRSSSELTPSMRYILVDWLVEVAGMKDFSTRTLHVAINVVDRYLGAHKTTRSKLQLLGVAAMVICSRFLGRDIITIREAAWLTDNTYKYEDVVRMMGEISATLKGNFRVCTSLDYVEVFSLLANLDTKTRNLTEFICELTLLQAEMGQFTAAEIAASCVLLARLVLKEEFPWPQNVEEFTAFSIIDLHRCAVTIHRKCFLDGAMIDHREVTLQAVKQRYSDEKFQKVGELQMMKLEELCCSLGVSDEILHSSKQKQKLKRTEELIVSPSRSKTPSKRRRNNGTDRSKASTPTIEDGDLLSESAMSGYEGDEEDGELEDSLEYDECASEKIEGMEEDDTYFASLSNTSLKKEREKTYSLELMLPSWLSSSYDCDLFQQLQDKADNCAMEGASSSGVFSSPRSRSEFSPCASYTFTSDGRCSATSPSPTVTSVHSSVGVHLMQSDSGENDIDQPSNGACKSDSLFPSLNNLWPCDSSSASSVGKAFIHSNKRKSSRQLGSATKTFVLPKKS